MGLREHPRWRRLAGFAEKFAPRPIGNRDGFAPPHLQRAEARLGISLPPALKEWYELAGRRRDLGAGPDSGPAFAPAPDRLRLTDDGSLVLCDECQGVVTWGVSADSLALEDPPVLGWEEETGPRVVVNATTSEFFLQLAIFLRAYARPEARGFAEGGEATLDRIASTWPRLPLPVWWWGEPVFTFFGDDRTVVVWDATHHIGVAARDKAALAHARSVLDGQVKWF